MQQIILIFRCLVIGIVLRLTGRLPDNATKVLGGFVINVALPAAALRSVHQLALHPDWWLAAATPWLGAALAIIVIVPLCRALGWASQRTGALLLVAGWGNTSFVGLPMISAFAGSQWLPLGIVIDLFGSYLAPSTLGLTVASAASSGKFDWRAVAKRIVTFPPPSRRAWHRTGDSDSRAAMRRRQRSSRRCVVRRPCCVFQRAKARADIAR
jgi:malate permease and related proteins